MGTGYWNCHNINKGLKMLTLCGINGLCEYLSIYPLHVCGCCGATSLYLHVSVSPLGPISMIQEQAICHCHCN